ncbi:MAG: histidine phosphatase family protein [Candidatus Thorarchaeota archaeon]|jgi:broad specificity phosphatase PhoE
MLNKDLDWEKIDWLASARNLTEWVNQRPPDERVMIFLRHSHREVIQDHSTQFSTGLTEIGKQMSHEMGSRLAATKPIRIFFSFIPRSHQTAEELASGLKENDGEIVEFESIAILVMPEFSDEAVWDNLQPDGKNVTEFVNRWADGEFGDMIESFDEYRNRLVETTLGRLMKETESVLHIHVSHDLALMALKRILLQRPIDEHDREPFQGGICTSIDKEGNSRLYNTKEETRLSPIE